jgi:hypothetical protein
MADIIQEVEEKLREDTYLKLFRRFAPILAIAVVALVGGVAWMEYSKFKAGNEVKQGALHFEAGLLAIENGDDEAAKAAFNAAAEVNAGYAALSAPFRAEIGLTEPGGFQAGADLLEFSADRLGDTVFAPANLLKAAYLRSVDQTREELTVMVAPLIEQGGGYAALARELLAAKAFEEGDYDFARSEYSLLRLAPDAPPGVGVRSERVLALLDQIAPAPEPAPAEIPAETTAETIAEEPAE